MKTNDDSQEQNLTDTNRIITVAREEIIQENHLLQGANSCVNSAESTENNPSRQPDPTVNAVQEASERAIDESAESQPSPDIETLLLRRDQVNQLIQTHTRTRQELDTEIRTRQRQPGGGSPPSSRLTDVDREELENCVAIYGPVSEMSDGSIIIRILLVTLEGLEKLCQHYNDKTLTLRFQTCLREKTSLVSPSSTFENFAVEIDLDVLDGIKTYLQAEELSEDISYTFCPAQKTWFWSVDRVSWQHVDQFLVTSGEFKGKKPKREDVETLLKFDLLNDDPSVLQKQKDCFCCRKGLLHEGVSVSPLQPPNEIDVKISWDNIEVKSEDSDEPHKKELSEALENVLGVLRTEYIRNANELKRQIESALCDIHEKSQKTGKDPGCSSSYSSVY